MRNLFSYFVPTLVLSAHFAIAASELPQADTRAGSIQTLNTPRTFPHVHSKAEWQAIARDVREQTLVSCGLWPMPERHPLNAQVFGRVERDGYSIEKVYFQPHPGFYLGGNLYRPLKQGPGPFPGVLNPHGHWKNGRMADEETGSIAARCITMARNGMVAFSYDMVGYNDTFFPESSKEMKSVANFAKVHRQFATNAVNQLWSISLMGLQTWNSIRALDFLESLPDVDPKRLSCTGESGGATQTFMLGAIDDRLAMQAPIVMVSHSMQGGCLCENAPGLRVKYSNMEIAASAAPRPQVMVAATGDWTKTTMTVEGPAVESVYRLFNAGTDLRYYIFNFPHNYNRVTRTVVYEAFDDWLLPTNKVPVLETSYVKEPDHRLWAFPTAKLPTDAMTEKDLIERIQLDRTLQWNALKPVDRPSLARYREVVEPLWRHSLQVDRTGPGDVWFQLGKPVSHQGYTATEVTFGRPGKGDRLPGVLFQRKMPQHPSITIIANPQGKAAYVGRGLTADGLAYELLREQESVLVLDLFMTGSLYDAQAALKRDPFTNFFTTYNRTDLQERIQDLATAAAMCRHFSPRVVVCGVNGAGTLAMLAAPLADAVVADADGVDPTGDGVLMRQDMFSPGLRNFGLFEGAAAIAAPNPMLIHHTGNAFPTAWLQEVYGKLKPAQGLQVSVFPFGDVEIARWVAGLKR